MIKIIEEGKKESIGICSKCGCKFSYELKDLNLGLTCYTIDCPNCAEAYYHLKQPSEELIYKI